uniref:Uncharacterized protein n=1 Tax=Bubo bubo TaxID=30461 RepID=A0A8C0IDM9_BUBBB
MYPESTTDSPARLSLRQTGSPGMIYSAPVPAARCPRDTARPPALPAAPSRPTFLMRFVASFFFLPFAVGSARYGSPKRQLQFYR